MLSLLDLFRIGIGPSSSHTVGPMRAARHFVLGLSGRGLLERIDCITVDLYGSLGATGRGHGSDRAILLGLTGESPETVAPDAIDDIVNRVRADELLRLLDVRPIGFVESEHLRFTPEETLPLHPNGLRFRAWEGPHETAAAVYYSTGGGFVVDEAGKSIDPEPELTSPAPYPFGSAAELLAHCDAQRIEVSDVMMANETALRSEGEIRRRILEIWVAMRECVARGRRRVGQLPGRLQLRRRAADLHEKLVASQDSAGANMNLSHDPLAAADWVDMYAMAVSEENAAGGRVVTAPTNGAAGVVPAVLHYFDRFCGGAGDDMVVRFLLTAGAIGILYKVNASISGAEVGCQGEIGSACSMAAGALTEILGGTVHQVENAAEIGMEHNLGLTCDPVEGMVQIPCIERNAMAAVEAINAAHMALRGDGRHFVSLDTVIRTMRETGADMQSKYKETSVGGLAVNVTVC